MKKPACTKFIVAAIKEVRRKKLSGMKEGVSAGVRLHQIFAIATAVYTPKEFRKGLETLLRNNTLILSAKLTNWNRLPTGGRNHGRTHIIRITEVPSVERCTKELWDLDEKGEKEVSGKNVTGGKEYWHIKLHVVTDGLPAAIARLVTDVPLKKNHGSVEAVAAKILKQLSK